ncbi:MAG: hypothetical protein V1772_11775 [Chloroflexota bacterium]
MFMIREAMSVFWQALKDTWEELYSLAIANLVWLFSWALPIGIGTATGVPIVIIITAVLSLVALPITTAGMYAVTNRVARGRTFHFADLIDAIKLYWWRSLLWMLANAVFVLLVYMNLWFYPTVFKGTWVVFIAGLWLAIGIFWLAMQMYFWPILIEQERPRLLLAWRNCAYLILANPFYAFFVASFSIVLLGISVGLTLPFIFVGMALMGLLANNAVLTLYVKFGIIEDPRPKPTGGR